MDFHNKCRTCLRIPKQPKHLFNDNTLLEKIQIIASVEIRYASELPYQICEECFTNINHFYNFRKVIVNTEHDLQTRLETLKKTCYSVRPQSEIKQYLTESENASNIDVKSELDIKNNVLNSCDNNPEDNVDFSDGEANLDVENDTTMENVFKCEQCEKSFTSTAQLNDHKHLQHPEVECNICGRILKAGSLKIHIKLHLDERPCTCEICGKTLKNFETFRKHKFLHSQPKQAFTCEICGNTFRRRSDCFRHIKRKHKDSSSAIIDTAVENVFSCPDCEQTYTSRLQLRKHRRANHLTGICNICGAMMRADNLPKHVKLHSEEPCTCDICGKTVKNSESLRFHKTRHMQQQDFTCEICGIITKTKRNYYRHLRYHKDPDFRKIICSICGQKVVDLKRHMLTHTGARPYNCTYCEKGFTSPYALKVHTRQHTKEKPYICEYCSESFPQKVSLKTHLRNKHGLAE